MAFDLIFDEEAIEFLNGLPDELKGRIFNKLRNAKENPFHFFGRLEGRTDYKLRIGDYRAVADIDENSKKIKVTMIGHRKNIYQNI